MNKAFYYLFHLVHRWALGGDEVSLLLLEYGPHAFEGQHWSQVWLPQQRIGQSRSDVLAALDGRGIELLPEAEAKLKAMPEHFWKC
jgi:hypothetical protein